MTPEELADYDAETVRLVEIKESECIEADANAESLKSQYTSAKKLAEHATSKLLGLIRERRRGRVRRGTGAQQCESAGRRKRRWWRRGRW